MGRLVRGRGGEVGEKDCVSGGVEVDAENVGRVREEEFCCGETDAGGGAC